MDHSYCLPTWTFMEDESQVKMSDLLTDHTYALPSGSCWTEPFDSVHDWYSDSSPPPDPSIDVQSAVTIDNCPPSGPHTFLDSLFSRIELHIQPGSELELLQNRNLSAFPSLRSNGIVLHGSPSEVFQLLLAVDSTHRSNQSASPPPRLNCPSSPIASPAHAPINVPDDSRQEAESPIYVTIIQKDSKKAFKSKKKVAVRSRDRRQLRISSKLHKCPKCYATFTRHFSLTEHVRMIHDRIPRYRCRFCDHGFKRPALLRDHIYSKHAHTSRFICPVCHKGFIRRPDCLRHQQRRHCFPNG